MERSLITPRSKSAYSPCVQTQIWTQGEYADFERGVIKDLSIRSDGLLSLPPHSHELFDTSAAYLWALAQDSKGNLYTAGGTGAKLFRIPPGGPGKMVAEVDALEIHAIAVDSKDRVYFGTAPDGKVYRMTGAAKPEVFYDPKAKYIWALAFNGKGDLLVATGGLPNGQGEIHKVPPDGKGAVFFKTDEPHVRSMAVEANDSLIVGTEPGGLVMRISPSGEGFVLYQMSKKEVTAVAVGRDGSIYASAVGVKQGGSGVSLPPPSAPPPPASGATITVNMGAPAAAAAQRPRSPPPASVGTSGVSGGSEVYRIETNGNPRRIWSNAQDVVYAIAFDAQGRVLLGAGNKGSVYRIESPTEYTVLLSLPVTQITAFQSGPGGRLYAAAGNTGKVYEIGPEVEQEGSIESDVFDSGMFTLWGRLSFEAHLNGGHVALATRSGNLDRPQNNWSAWAAVPAGARGGPLASPAARFVQWKATREGGSPELDSVDVASLPKNLEPRIDDIEATPPNYRFPAVSAPLIASQATLSLPPIGKRANPASTMSMDNTPAMQYAKGFIGARWAASDPNGDPLLFTVQIRGTGETEWKLLKDKVAERYFSWDSTAWPDGEYSSGSP